jgi:hypothetical protein
VFKGNTEISFNEFIYFYSVADPNFSNSSNLKEITVGGKSTRFNANMSNCVSLRKVIFEESDIQLSISSNFSNVPLLNKVVFPKRLYQLSGKFTGYCYNKRFLSETPPILENPNFESTELIFVPQESVDLYKSATNWSEYANMIYPYSNIYPEYNEAEFSYNQALYYANGNVLIADGMCVSQYIEVTNCTSVICSIQRSPGTYCSFCEYDENKKFIDYWGADYCRTINLTGKEKTKYIRLCFEMSRVEDCFLFDRTNGKYIFIGENLK